VLGLFPATLAKLVLSPALTFSAVMGWCSFLDSVFLLTGVFLKDCSTRSVEILRGVRRGMLLASPAKRNPGRISQNYTKRHLVMEISVPVPEDLEGEDGVEREACYKAVQNQRVGHLLQRREDARQGAEQVVDDLGP
jgi:hypothetical protein